MIHFSVYDNERSIPNLMDGQKLGQRKILYAAFKKGLTRQEIKVAQFSGYVSEHSGYHHGEASLNATIVGMAQNYVGSNNINLFEPNGQFGCIDPETPVLLWSGEIERAKNIKVGDKLIGDDGECRIVSKLTDGVDEMYEVSNGNMDNYVVNSHHILTVSYSKHKSVFWKRSAWYMYYFDDATKTVKTARTRVAKPTLSMNPSSVCFEYDRLMARAEMSEFSNTISDDNTFDINVQQYLALPASVKVHVKGVVNTSVIQWKEQSLSIEPYTFGLCLGDGIGMVEDNKHVPIEYVVNSEENRLKLLAGMIDTDGCLRKQNECYRYTISQCEKRKHLLESFRIIAGSLGFRAKILKSTDDGMFELSITGDNIHKIPVKLPRKQIGYHARLRNNCGVHKIEIKSIGRGAFCGWNIDKNERFLLGDFTITHNTRLQGGKDSASERYIFTMLNPLTRLLFRPEDDGIMKYLNDDGELVEPVFYAPIIPMILVNGTKGIGTGFSTDIMCYNPIQIIAYMKALLASEKSANAAVDAVGGLAIEPYYHGFKGTISAATATTLDSASPGPTKYVIKGVYSVIDDHRVRVSELPVGYWTEDFKTHLESLMETPPQTQSGAAAAMPFVKEYCDMSTDSVVDFTITLTRPIHESDRCSAGPTECNALEKMLKLHTTQTTSNMNLFDEREQLHKYDTVYEIARAFFRVRCGIYEQRKETMLAKLRNDLSVLSNRARYIQEQLDDTLDLRRQKRDALLAVLKTKTYAEHDGGYDYLLKMPMDGVTDEKVGALLHERDTKRRDYDDLVQTSAAELWVRDLDALERAYLALLERQRVAADLSLAAAASKSGAGGTGNMAGIKIKKTVMVKRKPFTATHNVDNDNA